MPESKSIRLFPALAAVLVLALAACGDGNPERADAEIPGEPGLPPSLDPALALSTDPVDQMNFLLGKAVRLVPGEPIEVRYQVRLLPGDSVSIDYEQHAVGEDWPPAPARAVGLLSEITAEVVRGRGVELVCGEVSCLEYQAALDSLSFPRLPEGSRGDWFRTLVEEMAGGSADAAGAGGADAINRRLRDSALHYSETVRTWYQARFEGAWMRLETWQQTQGFPENMLPSTLHIYLPNLEATAPGVFECSDEPCVLDVEATPFQVVLETEEDAARFVELFNGLPAEG